MTTSADIVNRALIAIGARANVTSLQERSPEAEQANWLYVPTRQALLRAAHWNFARKTAYLTVIKSAPGTPTNPGPGTLAWDPATQPAPPWLYEYAYPSDCLQVRFVQPQISVGFGPTDQIFSVPSYTPVPNIGYTAQRFQVATDTDHGGQQVNVILTNQGTAICIYTMDIVNENLWDGLFQQAMVESLGSQLALQLNGNVQLARLQAGKAMEAINQARARDGDEGLTVNDHTPGWIAIRGWAGDWSQNTYGPAWVTPSFLLI